MKLKIDRLKKYLEEKKIQYVVNHSIKPYVTMEIGGKVRLITVIYKDFHLKELLLYLHNNRYIFLLLGGGSNVIFTDRFSQLIVIINRTSDICREEDHTLKVNSGTFNKDLMDWNIRGNIGGMDFLAGIPGTVGGAAAVNAGAFGKSISTILQRAEIFNRNGEIETVDNDYFRFSYRDSAFKYGSEIILNVFLKFMDADSDDVKKKVEANVKYREENHPCSSYRSAGCFFKNPIIDGKKISAGKLIEHSGFKGTAYNTLQVSHLHANFVINSGSATFDDIKDLEAKIAQKVFQEKNIKLEREIIYISPEGKKY